MRGMDATIRLATEADAPAMLAIYTPYVRETAISFEAEPPPIEEFTQRVRSTLEYAPWLACVERGQVAGYAYGGRWRPRAAYRWTIETTVYVARARHGRGVGRALYRALLACLKVQGFRTATAGITLPNDASVRLHERVGFEPVGVFHAAGHKFGRWHDVGWYELALGARVPDPPETIPTIEASLDPGWSAALAEASAGLG